MKELWKPAYGFSNYECSNLGRVRSIDRVIIRIDGKRDTKKGVILKSQKNKSNGYLQVNIYLEHTKRKCVYVHKLVAQTFLGVATGLTINHKDGNIENNCITNLEYISYSDNLKHSYDNLNRPVTKPVGKRKKVGIYIIATGETKVFKNLTECARYVELSPTQVRRILKKETKSIKYNIYYTEGSETIESIS